MRPYLDAHDAEMCIFASGQSRDKDKDGGISYFAVEMFRSTFSKRMHGK